MSLRKHFSGDPVVTNAFHSDRTQQGYRSEDDAHQVASLVEDLIQHHRHIVLSCRDADTLDHYSRLLVRDLRQRESVKVVPYFPSSTEVLLTRLNELLAQITIEQAMRRDQPAGQDLYVFVLHDTPSLANAELTLLVQLINDFPGTQLRLVLVLDSEDHEHLRLPLLGKRSRHWDVPVSVGAETVAREARPMAEQIPVLHKKLVSESAAEPVRTAWWQRVGQWLSRKSAPAMAALCMLTLGAVLGVRGWSDATSSPVASLLNENLQWVGPIVGPSQAATPAAQPVVAIPAWHVARCAPAPAGADSVCSTTLS